jgi:hypothetical protein
MMPEFCTVSGIMIKLRIADHASNMKSTAEALGLKYYGCFAHCLNLIVDKTIKVCNIEAIDSSELNANETQKSELCQLLDRCRALVGTFNHSTQMTDQLIKLQEDENINGEKLSKVRLIQDVVTRLFKITFYLGVS